VRGQLLRHTHKHTKTTTHTEIAHTHALSDTDTILGVRVLILTVIPVGARALGPVQRLGGWEAADCNHPDRPNTETNANTNTNTTTFNAIQNATVEVVLACVCVCDLFLFDNYQSEYESYSSSRWVLGLSALLNGLRVGWKLWGYTHSKNSNTSTYTKTNDLSQAVAGRELPKCNYPMSRFTRFDPPFGGVSSQGFEERTSFKRTYDFYSAC